MKKFWLTLLFLIPLLSLAQTGKRKVPSYFGFQYKQVFPTKFIGEKELTLTQDMYQNKIAQTHGFLFGATVRVGLTDLIAIETGLDFTQRNFLVDLNVPDSNIFLQRDLRFIEYGLPINALMYIRLAEKWYMNASVGFATVFKPTDVRVDAIESQHNFLYFGIARNKVGIDLNGNIGFEFRTEKDGFFYLGGSARIPFAPIFDVYSRYKYEGTTVETTGKLDGSYFSLDFKYFFPNVKSKKVFQEGPIE